LNNFSGPLQYKDYFLFVGLQLCILASSRPHGGALAFGYYFRYHDFMAEEFTYKDFNLLSSAHAWRIQGHCSQKPVDFGPGDA